MLFIKFMALCLLLTVMFSIFPELNAQEINWLNNSPCGGKIRASAEDIVVASVLTNENITLVSRALLGPARAVFVKGDYVYVGAGGALVIFDVSTPKQPALISKVYVPDVIRDIFVSENKAYTVGDKLRIYDISNPLQPQRVDTGSDLLGGRNIEIVGDYAYIAAGCSGLRIIDISNPIAPVELGSFAHDWAEDLRVVGNYAYVAFSDGLTDDASWAFWVIDISDKMNPQGIGFYDPEGDIYSIEVLGNYVFISGAVPLKILDISEPTSPQLINEVLYGGFDMQISDSLLYLTWFGLTILDISQPTEPQMIARYTEDFYWKLHVLDDTVYLAAGYSGLQILDTSDPTTPQAVGGYPTGGGAQDVWAYDDYAYVQDVGFFGDIGLHVIDISDPHIPEVVGYLPSIFVSELYAVGDNLYLALDGLKVFDISDLSDPQLVTHIDGIDVSAIDIVENRAYVMTNSALKVLDITDPDNLSEIGHYGVSNGQDIVIEGNLAYLACAGEGLRILDVSNLGNIYQISQWDSVNFARDVFVEDNHVYIGDDVPPFYQLHIINASDLSSPCRVNSHYIGSIVGYPGIYVDGKYGYFAEYFGLRCVDISNPYSIRTIGSYSILADGYCARSVCAKDGYIYLSYDDGGLHILQLDSTTAIEYPQEFYMPEAFALYQNYPNPFNAQTCIEYDLPRDAHVSLRIYNILGQRVKTLADDFQPAGRYQVFWDGRDGMGSEVASGIYFIRLETVTYAFTRKMVLLR